MMDIEAGNALPDPYSDVAGDAGQSVYPWRGRITVSPAPGFAGSPDKTASAGTQVADFLGTADATDFSSSSGATVTYTGPSEWSYRRFILHMAKICELADGVDMFCLGSEMVAMTRARSAAATYPFVDGLIDLAGEVRAILGAGTRIGYAADWSEYHSHRPDDGSGDVLFNLDPLWSDAHIDFIGIDNYLPLSDWRDGTEYLDYSNAGPTTIYDQDYMKANVEGGEYYDWYYASDADRASQTRTTIEDTDPAAEHWVFRNKDVRNWWLNAHHDRPGGTRSGSATTWSPESKPIIFPNSAAPRSTRAPTSRTSSTTRSRRRASFRTSRRVPAMSIQRAYPEAAIGHWGDDANNPESGVYAGRMIETVPTCIWSWDARMVPSFHRTTGRGPMLRTGNTGTGSRGASALHPGPRPSRQSWMSTALPIMRSSRSAQPSTQLSSTGACRRGTPSTQWRRRTSPMLLKPRARSRSARAAPLPCNVSSRATIWSTPDLGQGSVLATATADFPNAGRRSRSCPPWSSSPMASRPTTTLPVPSRPAGWPAPWRRAACLMCHCLS